MKKQPEIIISTADLAELEFQIARIKQPDESIKALEDELARATIVSVKSIPSNVVTIDSQVTFKVSGSGRTFTKTLCLASCMDKYDDSISIFAPIGSAIIGLSKGQSIEWQIQGVQQSVEIVNVNKPIKVNGFI